MTNLTIRLSISVLLMVGCGGTQSAEPSTSAPASYEDASYKKLGSEAFIADYDGSAVHFKAMFIGESVASYYGLDNTDSSGRVFINHRDVAYAAQETGLGSSDAQISSFALSLPKGKSEIVYEMNRGDVFEVWGRATKIGGYGKNQLHVMIDRIAKND